MPIRKIPNLVDLEKGKEKVIPRLRDVMQRKTKLKGAIAGSIRHNPDLLRKLQKFVAPDSGIPKEKLTVPIAPLKEFTDEVLFEDGVEAGKKCYLPRFRLAEERVSGQSQYRIVLKEEAQGWSLIIHMDKYPAPSLQVAAREAAEMNFELEVLLHYRLRIGGAKGNSVATKELVFQEVTEEGQGIKAVLHLATMGERDQIYGVLTDPEYGGTLVVRRAVKAAVPLAETATTPVIVSSGQGTIRGTWVFNFDTGTEGGKGDVWWRQQSDIQRSLAPQGEARIVNLGRVDFNRITEQQLISLSYGSAPLNGSNDSSNQLVNGIVFAVRTNGGNYAKVQVVKYGYNLEIRWVTYKPAVSEPEPEPKPRLQSSLFEEVTRVLDNLVEPEPFVFPPEIHKYIFQNISFNSTPSFGLIRRQVDASIYYQDQAQPHIFYYLPDSFKIGRRLQVPYNPLMTVRFDSEDDSPERLQVTLEYMAFPYVDEKRLERHASRLKPLAGTLPLGIEEPVLLPLLVDGDNIRFRLALPGSQQSLGPFQERPGAMVNLSSGLFDSLPPMSLEDFQRLYDALFGGSFTLFQGEIHIDLGEQPDLKVPPIPFSARMNDLVGEVFEYEEVADEETGGLRVTLRNAIESSVQISCLGAKIRRGERQVRAYFRELRIDPPTVLQPGEEVTFWVIPSEPLPGQEPMDAIFDLSQVEILPDPEAVWQAILDPRTKADYVKEVTVRTYKEAYDEIREIIVHFEQGDTVSLNPEHPEAAAKVHLLIRDWILGREDRGTYRYRQTVVYQNGDIKEVPWRQDTTTILIPEAN